MSLTINVVQISRRHTLCALGTCTPKRYSTDIKPLKKSSLSALKRGTGGRSSFNGIVATVFGATGYIGSRLVNELGKTGTQVIVPYRSDPDDYEVKKLKLCGDLGQILFQPFHLKDPLSIRKAIKYSNVVINLIGCHFETRNFKFKDVHEIGAREIARACSEFNIERFIHISSLSVTETPKNHLLRNYAFLPSKLRGEQAVMEEFPEATIIRPATVFGDRDRFLWALNLYPRRTGLSIPVWKRGKCTVKQPIFVGDVVDGIMAALRNPESKGQIYEAAGPEKYLLYDILQYCSDVCAVDEQPVGIHDIRFDPIAIAKIIISRYIIGRFWFHPVDNLCLEQIEMEAMSDVRNRLYPSIEDLGVKLTFLEEKGQSIVRSCYQFDNTHYKDLVAYKPVPPPKPYQSFC